MARFARVIAVDFPHHITHRGNRQADVFLSDEGRLLYLRLLAQYGLSAQLDIWGYCLMSNHVHLIVVPAGARSGAGTSSLRHDSQQTQRLVGPPLGQSFFLHTARRSPAMAGHSLRRAVWRKNDWPR